MGMLRTCAAPGCSSFTLGELCIEHEVRIEEIEEPETNETAEPTATKA
ncbi:MAG TPA: hypothetical protein VHC01_05310 [Gaiellaceae bacterium]|jgi:hypothetical protein|nr:hypothetical protein [Gaiellaceae bacterium]